MRSKRHVLRIVDDSKVDEFYDDIHLLLHEYSKDITLHEALGVLDCVKTDLIDTNCEPDEGE